MHHEYEDRASIGERLRRAREAKGLTLDDVATQTRIPIRHLRALEDADYEKLPAVTYTVGFARSYANSVDLDGAEIGRELREQIGDGPRVSQVSPAVYDPPDPARVPPRSLAWVAAILLVVLAAGYLIWRSQLGDTDEVPVAAPAAPATQQPAQPVAAQPQQPALPPDLAGQPVTLVATGPVWLQITDRGQNNRRIYSGELSEGETYRLPEGLQQPVIRTGRPQVLGVRIGSQDLGPLRPTEQTISNVSLIGNDLVRELRPSAATPAAAAAAPGGAAPVQPANGLQPAR